MTDHEEHARKFRGGVFFQKLGIDLYPHPYLGFSLPRNHRSAALNTDDEGFRLSSSPLGTVDSKAWLDGGGGGLVLGSSVAFGLAASSDEQTLASQLAALTGKRWLNLAVLAANSAQELIAAVPYLHAADTVVLFTGMGNYLNLLRTRNPENLYGPLFYEGTFAKIANVPLFDLADLVSNVDTTEILNGIPPLEVPAEADLSHPTPRVEAAAAQHIRDLTFIARAAPSHTRILFCLQPLATPRTRALTKEEQEGYDFTEPIHGIPFDVLEGHLELYTELLAKGCTDLGVEFVNVSADRFVGQSFITNGVLTDLGNEQATRIIHGVLSARAGLDATTPPSPA